MTNATTKPTNKALALIAVMVLTLALTVVLGLVVGCSPQGGSSDAPKGETQQTEKEDPMANQAVEWTMDIDCKTCHTTESESMADTGIPQASEHAGLECVQCHTEESVLKTAHEGVTSADKPASKPTVITVDAETCQSPDCHGTMEEMAAITADNQDFKDEKGKVQNPHDYPSNEQHDTMNPTCTDCHNIHSKNLQKDAMMWCAQCHHKGVFQCGTCHELRERAVQ